VLVQSSSSSRACSKRALVMNLTIMMFDVPGTLSLCTCCSSHINFMYDIFSSLILGILSMTVWQTLIPLIDLMRSFGLRICLIYFIACAVFPFLHFFCMCKSVVPQQCHDESWYQLKHGLQVWAIKVCLTSPPSPREKESTAQATPTRRWLSDKSEKERVCYKRTI